jgi:hypothetical protein
LTKHSHTKLIHEGHYVAEVDLELLEDDNAWSPYLSLDDAKKLDEIRQALRREDAEACEQIRARI